MEDKKQDVREVHNHFEANSNCQVFNGPISGAIFAMPGSTVHQHTAQEPVGQETEGQSAQDFVEPAVPAELCTAEAEHLWQRLRTAGFIVSGGYGLAADVSANQAAYIADCMAARLGIKCKWKPFQQLWGIRNMAQLAGSWQQTGKLPPRSKEIERLME